MTKSRFGFAAIALVFVGLVTWLMMQTGDVSDPGPSSDPTAPAAAAATANDQLAASPSAETPSNSPDATPESRVTVAATAALTVSGEVLNRGVPYPDFAFTLQWFAGLDTTGQPESEHKLRSDRNGRFAWHGDARKHISTVRVIAPSAQAKVWSDAKVVQADTTEVSLKLSVVPLDRELFGRVHDAAGQPIVGARLTINGWAETATVSDDDGRYELRVPTLGYPLLVTAANYQYRLVQAYMPDETRRHEFDVEMQPGVAFRGRVVDGAAQPIAGAKVRASGLFDGGVLTEADGRFELGGARPGSRHEITATKSGFQPGKVITKPGGESVVIVLLPGLELTLKVTDAKGAAIVGAAVSVVPTPQSGWLPRGMTGVDGRKHLQDLAPGPFDVIVQKPGFIRDRRTVDAEVATGDVVISLQPGYAISGRIVDTAGAPVPGASVYCQRPQAPFAKRSVGTTATSDAQGRFKVIDLPPEPCTIFAFLKGYSRASAEGVVGPRTGLVLRMKPAPMVVGRTVDGTTGDPIAEFKVRIASDYKVQSLRLKPLLFKDCDGYWKVQSSQMKAGAELFVEVSAEGYAPARIRGSARIDPPRDQNVVRLLPGRTVVGVLRDKSTDAPIVGARVLLEPGDPKDRLHQFFQRGAPDSRRAAAKKTDAEGRFSIESVPAGPNRLVLSHSDYPRATFGPFDVLAGPGRLEVRPTMAAGVTLRGRVTGVANAAGRTVRAESFRQRSVETKVLPDQTFVLTGLGQDRYMIILDGKRSHCLYVDVGASDIDGVELALRAGSGSIRATIRGLDSGYAQIASIDTKPGARKTLDGLQFEGGSFVLRGLTKGQYRVEVSSRQHTGRGTAKVQVKAGEATVVVEYREND